MTSELEAFWTLRVIKRNKIAGFRRRTQTRSQRVRCILLTCARCEITPVGFSLPAYQPLFERRHCCYPQTIQRNCVCTKHVHERSGLRDEAHAPRPNAGLRRHADWRSTAYRRSGYSAHCLVRFSCLCLACASMQRLKLNLGVQNTLLGGLLGNTLPVRAHMSPHKSRIIKPSGVMTLRFCLYRSDQRARSQGGPIPIPLRSNRRSTSSSRKTALDDAVAAASDRSSRY